MTTTKPIPATAPAVAREMANAANAFLNSLDQTARQTATYNFGDDERYLWTYVPEDRNGLRVRAMSEQHRGERGAGTQHHDERLRRAERHQIAESVVETAPCFTSCIY